MKITIDGDPKEIAALVLELQERQEHVCSGNSFQEALEELGLSTEGGDYMCFKNLFKCK